MGSSSDGTFVTLGHHGGFGGVRHVLNLANGEHMIRINGHYGNVVTQINILTDGGQTLSGGGGGDAGIFEYQAPPGIEIAGFFGRSGNFVDAIGVVLRTIPTHP
jgi:hypothetical protein